MLIRHPGRICKLLLMVGVWALSPVAQAQYTLNSKLPVPNEIAEQGFSVALSSDGNTGLVGGPQDNNGQGAAWVWTNDGGTWILTGGSKLVATDNVGAAQQGHSVALSADGNTALVGGPFDLGSPPLFQNGAAWVFTRNSAGFWDSGTKLFGAFATGGARQGWSVALSADGNTALIGGDEDNGGVGAVWVFTRSGTAWPQQRNPLRAPDAVGAASQGQAVALSADGNTALIGGSADSGGAGAAWVWTRAAGVWSEQAKLPYGSGAMGSPVAQGFSVALSADGNTALVGGDQDNGGVGAVWVYTRSGTTWSQQGIPLRASNAMGAAGQGSAVSLSADGNLAVIGGPDDSGDAGAAWVWTRLGGGLWIQLQKLVGSGAIGNAGQGTSVALSAGNGARLFVGGPFDNGSAPGLDVGAVWAFDMTYTADGPFKVMYTSNLTIGDSVINMTNTGANGAGLGSGSTASVTGALCANVYVYNPDEEIVSCCSCPVTPNGLVALSAKQDLINNPLTPATPTNIVIKLLATAPVAGSCANSALLAGTLTMVPGLVAWGTHLHANTSAAAGTYQVTETGFTPATLSAAEEARLAYSCSVVANVGSGFGVCNSCRLGGLGQVRE
jgi:hypothetical protein